MGFFSYLYNIALILAFFGVVWKFVFVGFALGSLAWRPIALIGRVIGYYLLVSLIVLQTLVALEGTSLGWSLFMLVFAGALTFFIVGGGMAQAEKEMRQSMDYDGLEMLHYDGILLIGSLIFYVAAMFVPVIAATPPVFWAAGAIDWVAAIPIIGVLIAIYGAWTFLGLVFNMVLLGGIATVGSFFFLYKKTGIQERAIQRNAHVKFDEQFPGIAQSYTAVEKDIILKILPLIDQKKIKEQSASSDGLFLHFEGIGNLFFQKKFLRRNKIYLHFNMEKGLVVVPTTNKKEIREFLNQYKIAQ